LAQIKERLLELTLQTFIPKQDFDDFDAGDSYMKTFSIQKLSGNEVHYTA